MFKNSSSGFFLPQTQKRPKGKGRIPVSVSSCPVLSCPVLADLSNQLGGKIWPLRNKFGALVISPVHLCFRNKFIFAYIRRGSWIFLGLTLERIRVGKQTCKQFRTFSALSVQNQPKYLAANLSGGPTFYKDPFELYGRKFGQLATPGGYTGAVWRELL